MGPKGWSATRLSYFQCCDDCAFGSLPLKDTLQSVSLRRRVLVLKSNPGDLKCLGVSCVQQDHDNWAIYKMDDRMVTVTVDFTYITEGKRLALLPEAFQ